MRNRLGHLAPLLHLLLLSCLAFAQQLLDLLARNAELFVIRDSQPVDLVALVAILLLILPLPLLVLSLVASRIGGAVKAVTHTVLVALLVTVIALQALKALGVDSPAWLLAAAGGAAVGWLYPRWQTMRVYLTYLSPAILIVPVLFFSASGVRRQMQGPQSSLVLHRTGARAPIFFLVFDEFHLTSILDAEHQVDDAHFPHLAAFAGRATWLKNAATVSDVTQIALPAILTGRFPHADQLPSSVDHPENLFTLFGGDYAIYAREPMTRLCPPEINRLGREPTPFAARMASLLPDLAVVWLHLVVPAPAVGKLPPIDHTWQGFLAGAATADPPTSRRRHQRPMTPKTVFQAAVDALHTGDRDEGFRRFIDAIGRDPERVLYFGHFMLPHRPWEYLPSGRRYQDDGLPALKNDTWPQEDRWPVAQALQRYLLQVEYLDRLLGEFFSRLEELGLFDRSLIVLVADHGASFRPGTGRRVFSHANAPEIIPVPLFIKAPGQTEAVVVEEPVTVIDLLPTMLDMLSVSSPWPLDGRSARGADRGPRPIRILTKRYGEAILPPSLHREKYATLDWKLSLFGPSSDPLAMYRLGPHPELVGRRLSELGRVRPGRFVARFDGHHLYDDVDPSGKTIPALLTARITTAQPDPGCRDLAVAVNGTIFATARSHPATGARRRFTALLPEAAFAAGKNHLEVLVIREGDGRPVLERGAMRKSSTFALRSAAGRARAVVVDGRAYPLGTDLKGWIGSTLVDEETITVEGWAIDHAHGRLADEIVVFLDGKFLHAGGSSVPRPDVVERFGDDGFLEAGFRFKLARERVPELAASGLRLYALSAAGTASRLGYSYKRLEAAPDGSQWVVATDGRRVPVVPGAVAGAIDGVRDADGQSVRVTGWAFDRTRHRRPERIVVFVNGKLDPQLAVSRRAADQRGAFSVRMPLAAQSGLAEGKIRLIAISRAGVASEIPLVGGGEY